MNSQPWIDEQHSPSAPREGEVVGAGVVEEEVEHLLEMELVREVR
jgi:hypothetical protein